MLMQYILQSSISVNIDYIHVRRNNSDEGHHKSLSKYRGTRNNNILQAKGKK